MADNEFKEYMADQQKAETKEREVVYKKSLGSKDGNPCGNCCIVYSDEYKCGGHPVKNNN